MKPNVHAGRLERRVRRVGREIMPVIHGFCSLPLFSIRRNTRSTAIAPYRVDFRRTKPSLQEHFYPAETQDKSIF